ncbi:hypothetical protein HDV06_000354 [Boothiomyces sp. JEL0866]|nr:hypothetical protein HDV06_000354 [Boothiomyces sp. JEL0866]
MKSKYGLQVNGQKTDSAVLNHFDEVVIGGYGLKFQVVHKELSLCCSQITSKEKQELTNIANQKCISITNDIQKADLLLINSITTTEKVLLALTKPIPIVSSHWLKTLSLTEYPEYDLYLPLRAGYENINFGPDERRRTILAGKTFYFKNSDLYHSCKNIITNAGGNSVLNKKSSAYDDDEYLIVPEGDNEPYALEINDLSKAIMSVNSNFALRNVPAVHLDSISKSGIDSQSNSKDISKTSNSESIGLNLTESPLEFPDHEGILSRTRNILSEQLGSSHLNTQGESIVQKAMTQMPETATNFDDFMDDLFDLGTGNQNNDEIESDFKIPGESNEKDVLDPFNVPVKQEPDYTQTQLEVEETRNSFIDSSRFSNSINNSIADSRLNFEKIVDETRQHIDCHNYTNQHGNDIDSIRIKQEPKESQYVDNLPSQLDLNYTSQLDPNDMPIIPYSEQEPDLVEYILPSKRPQSQQIILPKEEESQLAIDPKVIVEFTDLVKKKYRPQTNFKRFKSKTKHVTVPLKVALITTTCKKGFNFED